MKTNSFEMNDIYKRLNQLEQSMETHQKEVTHDFQLKITELETKIEILECEKKEIGEMKTITSWLLYGSLFANLIFICGNYYSNDIHVVYT